METTTTPTFNFTIFCSDADTRVDIRIDSMVTISIESKTRGVSQTTMTYKTYCEMFRMLDLAKTVVPFEF